MKLHKCDHNIKRHFVLDFLHPMTPEDFGVFINKNSLAVEYDLEVFFKPFEKLTWITVLSFSLITSVLITR